MQIDKISFRYPPGFLVEFYDLQNLCMWNVTFVSCFSHPFLCIIQTIMKEYALIVSL